jgi:hypothetical protein
MHRDREQAALDRRPMWKKPHEQEQLQQYDLEVFSQRLQDGETMLHKKNDDPYDLLNDKMVQFNKQKGR